MAQAYFLNTITNVLGISVKKREVLYDDGYLHDNIREWFTTKSKLTTTRRGASY